MVSDRPRHIPALAARYDLSLPANQRKLEAADALAALAADCGLSLVHLSVAWVLEHPAVTAAIIGPRTMDQYLAYRDAAAVVLPDEVLDRIDEIVPPGTDIGTTSSVVTPALADPALRRRAYVSPQQ
jgi:aryl-alcohol dehydrogenase-like predicted oxidoreductase